MQSSSPLDSNVQFLRGVGPVRAEALAQKGIKTVRDVLFNFPRKYRDYTKLVKMADLHEGDDAIVCGRVLKSQRGNRFGRVKYKMVLSDASGQVTAIWFQPLQGLESFKVGDEIYVCGKVIYRSGFTMVHPSIERVAPETRRAGKITPVYSEVEGIGDTSWLRLSEEAIKTGASFVREILPSTLLGKHGLPNRADAIKELHQPSSTAKVEAARRRFVYEEFFLIQVAAALRRHYIRSLPKRTPKKMTPLIDERIRARFPYKFTADQDKAVAEIVADMTSTTPMNRLLQGDVGCGKTAVALYAALLTVANKQQAALLVPTDILAQQHFATVSKFLAGSRVRMELLTGSLPVAERNRVREALAKGEVDLVVGTHSLVTEGVEFAALGLAVIDEQHRFGVAQRAELRRKGISVDALVMTATPIPRTLAMTVFGDLEVGEIKEMPPGRKPIRTLRFPIEDGYRAHAFAVDEIRKGGQVYVVCPLIEESGEEEEDTRSALSVYESLSQGAYAEFRVGLAHGRMSSVERERTMDAFRAGELDVLVATSIIEVGLDVPNANVMIIERAERFGLATLHQLRGRVGRGDRFSYCLCVADLKSEEGRKRLDVFCSTSDGFKIAEEDLKMRGPGEVLGSRQSGAPPLKYGSLESDFEVLKMARADAFALIESGWRPTDELRAEIARYGNDDVNLAMVG